MWLFRMELFGDIFEEIVPPVPRRWKGHKRVAFLMLWKLRKGPWHTYVLWESHFWSCLVLRLIYLFFDQTSSLNQSYEIVYVSFKQHWFEKQLFDKMTLLSRRFKIGLVLLVVYCIFTKLHVSVGILLLLKLKVLLYEAKMK